MAKKKKKSIEFNVLPFIIIAAITLLFAFAKIVRPETQDVYVKIKISQGFWWASNTKPNIWFAQGIQKGDIEYSLFKKPIAEILEVRYYPFLTLGEDTYDIYLKVKLTTSYDKRKEMYVFKRSGIIVGAPIEIETSNSQISGTIIEVSEHEFDDKYEEKIVTLTKKLAYPWEYNAIEIGDRYFDGEDVVFEVLSKYQLPTTTITSDIYGNVVPQSMRYLSVKVKIKAKVKDGQLLFGEEKLLTMGSSLYMSTPTFKFDDNFVIGEINKYPQ